MTDLHFSEPASAQGPTEGPTEGPASSGALPLKPSARANSGTDAAPNVEGNDGTVTSTLDIRFDEVGYAQPTELDRSKVTSHLPPESTSSTTGVTNDLEEETYEPTTTKHGPQAGEVIGGYQLNEDLGRGWFTVSSQDELTVAEAFASPDPLWLNLRPHLLLPRATVLDQLIVLEPTGGTALTLPLPIKVARSHVAELARLLFALEKQGYAVIDLDPATIELVGTQLKLRRYPRVTHIGDVDAPAPRDGFTPPEVQAGKPVQATSGVYLLGALLYSWLTGQTLPTEGASPLFLSSIPVSGMPQLLTGMLAPAEHRLNPSQVLEQLKSYSARLPLYQVAAVTDIGLNPERPTNEDAYGYLWRQIGQHGGGEVALRACVCDGMGGMAAGEVASQAAVRGYLDSAAATFESRIWEANAAVLTEMAGRDGGCTISAVEIQGTRLQVGHVGDTRVYLAANGMVAQLTKDHSYVAAMVASGQMTEEEAQISPDRNKVLRSLGSLRIPQEQYVFSLPEPVELNVGDRVLLVSDGVWGELSSQTLQETLVNGKSAQQVAEQLVTQSLQAGAPDNITAVVIERLE